MDRAYPTASDGSAGAGAATEASQLSAIADGDAEVFAVWMAGAEPRIRASLARFAVQVDVEAVVQETLLRAWQLAPRVVLDQAGESLLRVAIRVARNLAIDETRRLRAAPFERESPDDLASDAAEHPPSTPDPFLRERIRRCRDELPTKPREALAARLDAGGLRREAELAAALGMRPNTFMQNLSRARKLLLACLERLGVSRAEVLS